MYPEIRGNGCNVATLSKGAVAKSRCGSMLATLAADPVTIGLMVGPDVPGWWT
jgi:hypothetical protein